MTMAEATLQADALILTPRQVLICHRLLLKTSAACQLCRGELDASGGLGAAGGCSKFQVRLVCYPVRLSAVKWQADMLHL